MGRAEPAEIDELNILHASMLAMERAVKALEIQPHFVLVDGNRIPPNLGLPAQAVVKGIHLWRKLVRPLFWQKSHAIRKWKH